MTPVLIAALACTSKPDASPSQTTTETRPPTETTAPTDTTPPTDTGGTMPTDTGSTAPGSGYLQREGMATVLTSWEGTETAVFVGDDGSGDELCRVSLSLVSTGSRDDCSACEWAFDLQVSAVETLTDVACAAVGWDSPEHLIGSTRAYGYTPDFHAHAPVVLVDGEDGWEPMVYGYWNEDSGQLRYLIEDGYFPY